MVGPEAVSANNTAGGIHFDNTVAVFDPLVVTEYLNGTGQQGGPLVTSFNVSSRSDLRLYNSDDNATMIELAQQGEGFLDTCSTLFQRMVETVPSNVVLSDVVSAMDIKPINATLDFDRAGNLIFTGYIRVNIVPTPTIFTLTNYPDSFVLGCYCTYISITFYRALSPSLLKPGNCNRDQRLWCHDLLPIQRQHHRYKFL